MSRLDRQFKIAEPESADAAGPRGMTAGEGPREARRARRGGAVSKFILFLFFGAAIYGFYYIYQGHSDLNARVKVQGEKILALEQTAAESGTRLEQVEKSAADSASELKTALSDEEKRVSREFSRIEAELARLNQAAEEYGKLRQETARLRQKMQDIKSAAPESAQP
jgi:vacuolar-type H+-ATPase subunit I/STV1